jgi:hypothetical protein
MQKEKKESSRKFEEELLRGLTFFKIKSSFYRIPDTP